MLIFTNFTRSSQRGIARLFLMTFRKHWLNSHILWEWLCSELQLFKKWKQSNLCHRIPSASVQFFLLLWKIIWSNVRDCKPLLPKHTSLCIFFKWPKNIELRYANTGPQATLAKTIKGKENNNRETTGKRYLFCTNSSTCTLMWATEFWSLLWTYTSCNNSSEVCSWGYFWIRTKW